MGQAERDGLDQRDDQLPGDAAAAPLRPWKSAFAIPLKPRHACVDWAQAQANVRRTIRSIRNARGVVDDGSTDGTADVALSFPEVQVIRQENAGNGAARNRAVEEASGGVYAFLDADDRFTPGKLSLQKAALDADPRLDMVFGQVREVVSPELDDETRAGLRPPEPMPWTAPNLMLIRRESFQRVGLFTAVRLGVTVDWFARAAEAGLRHTILPEVVLERRLHTENNGLRERASRSQCVEVIRQAMERRRAAAEAAQMEET